MKYHTVNFITLRRTKKEYIRYYLVSLYIGYIVVGAVDRCMNVIKRYRPLMSEMVLQHQSSQVPICVICSRLSLQWWQAVCPGNLSSLDNRKLRFNAEEID